MTADTIDTTSIDAIFSEWDRPDSPGCALGIVRGGELVYGRGYGMAHLEYGIPITTSSVFHVASVSKQFAAMAVALLARDGMLSLDDDVRRYVPEVPDLAPPEHPITIRRLMLHTSGLRDQWNLLWLAGWREDDLKTNDDVLDLVARQRALNFVPGAEHVYCNTGYTLLAVIVERVTGRSLRDFCQEAIFAPLGMASTHFHDDHSMVVPNRAYAYLPRDEGGVKISIPNFDTVGATSLFTTVEDLAKWVRNFGMPAGQRLGGEVLDEMMTPGHLNDGTLISYGLGLAVRPHRGLATVGHGGADAGYRSHLLWFPEVDFGVVILCNLGSMQPGRIAEQVAEVCLADRMGPDPLGDAPAVTLAEDALAANVGLYRDATTAIVCRVDLEDGTLGIVGPSTERRALTPLDGGRFRLDNPLAEVAFADGADGSRELRLTPPGGPTATYRAVEPSDPGIEELATYAGAYHCADVGASCALAVQDGTLVLRRRKFPERELRPTVADAFTDGAYHLVFRRDGRGRVAGFDLSGMRIRHVRFDRAG